MKKTVIILSAILFLANSCGNGQTKTTNNELTGEVVIPAERRQNVEEHDKIEGVAQNDVKDRILSENEVEQLFSDELKRTFDIQYPIFRVYAYSDNLGEHRIVLTENDNIQTNNNLNIKAFFFRLERNTLKKEREVYDSVNSNEISIWFWTKYCSFSDIDNDGLVEPIIVYGSKPEDGAPYRVNILIYYKGKKYTQRHKDGDLDFMRSTQIDKAFYALPKAIQERVKTITDVMIENGHVLEW